MRWPWQHREVEYMIQPRDIHLNPLSSDILTYLENEWEPIGVTAVPNTLDPNQIRLWMRRPVKFHKRSRYQIRIANAGWGGHEVLLHLTQGWEPFGVSDSYGNPIIWFRKKVER